MYDVVVTGGTVVSAAAVGRADLGLRDGRIAAIAAPGALGPGCETIDATGRHVLPGLVDAHVHLREPGFAHKEDVRSGTMAAAAGGATTVMAIPNTDPPLTTPAAFRGAVRAAAGRAVVDFAVFAGVRMDAPEALTAFDGSGAIGYDLYDDPYEAGSGHWIALFRRARSGGLPLAFYLGDPSLQAEDRRELEAAGATAAARFAAATTGVGEVLAMARIIPMAARFGVPVVLRAVTTPEGLAFVRQMRRAYPEARVTVEACVHHLFLTADDLAVMGARAQMIPPPRPAADVEALWQAVRDGTVDYLATDHAPHAPAEKAAGDLFRSPPGIIGLETLLPLMLDARSRGRLHLTDIVRLCCEGPARAFGVYPRKGSLSVGADADLVVVDAEARWRIDAGRFYSRGDRGPFDGREVTGRPERTVLRGRTVMVDGRVDPAPHGRFLTPSREGVLAPA